MTSLDNMYYVQKSEPRVYTRYHEDCDSYRTYIRTESDFIVGDERLVVLIKNVDMTNCDNPFKPCVRTAPDNCVLRTDGEMANPCS